MKEVVVYSKPQCSHCDEAKSILKRRGIPFTEIDVSVDMEARQVLVDAGFRSVPQLYLDGIHLGDSSVASILEV